MRQGRATTNDTGQQASWDRAETATARQLACLLASQLRIPALARWNEAEAVALLDYLNAVADEARVEGFSGGWHSAMIYNRRTAQLTSAPLSTGH